MKTYTHITGMLSAYIVFVVGDDKLACLRVRWLHIENRIEHYASIETWADQVTEGINFLTEESEEQHKLDIYVNPVPQVLEEVKKLVDIPSGYLLHAWINATTKK